MGSLAGSGAPIWSIADCPGRWTVLRHRFTYPTGRPTGQRRRHRSRSRHTNGKDRIFRHRDFLHLTVHGDPQTGHHVAGPGEPSARKHRYGVRSLIPTTGSPHPTAPAGGAGNGPHRPATRAEFTRLFENVFLASATRPVHNAADDREAEVLVSPPPPSVLLVKDEILKEDLATGEPRRDPVGGSRVTSGYWFAFNGRRA